MKSLRSKLRLVVPLILGGTALPAQTTVTLGPSHDAYVNDSAPANSFNNAFLVIGKSTQEFLPRYRSLLRFNLDSIPAGAVISSATLRLNLQSFEGSGTQSLEVHRVLATWSSATVTWNNQPAHDASVEVSRSPGTSVGSWYNFPIPALVQAWLDGTTQNHGVILRAASEATAAKTRTFASSSASDPSIRPQLEIAYSIPQDIDVTPPSFAFGNVKVGDTSTVLPLVTIKNLGGATLQVTRIDSKDPQFRLSAVPALPLGLPAGGSATFRVALAPAARGLQQTAIEVSSSDPDEPVVSVACTGTGTGPEIQVTPAALSFADQVVGMTSAGQPLRVKNEGDAALRLAQVASSSAQFFLAGVPALPANLAPGAEVALEVRFRPESAGPQNGNIVISSDDADEPVVSVQCTGMGKGTGPEIQVTPAMLSLADAVRSGPGSKDGSGRGDFASPRAWRAVRLRSHPPPGLGAAGRLWGRRPPRRQHEVRHPRRREPVLRGAPEPVPHRAGARLRRAHRPERRHRLWARSRCESRQRRAALPAGARGEDRVPRARAPAARRRRRSLARPRAGRGVHARPTAARWAHLRGDGRVAGHPRLHRQRAQGRAGALPGLRHDRRDAPGAARAPALRPRGHHDRSDFQLLASTLAELGAALAGRPREGLASLQAETAETTPSGGE
jgi:hypothetical protein